MTEKSLRTKIVAIWSLIGLLGAIVHTLLDHFVHDMSMPIEKMMVDHLLIATITFLPFPVIGWVIHRQVKNVHRNEGKIEKFVEFMVHELKTHLLSIESYGSILSDPKLVERDKQMAIRRLKELAKDTNELIIKKISLINDDK